MIKDVTAHYKHGCVVVEADDYVKVIGTDDDGAEYQVTIKVKP